MAYGQPWMAEVCKGLGLEPSEISRIVIELDAKNLVSITIHSMGRDSEAIRKLLTKTGQWASRISLIAEDGTREEVVRQLFHDQFNEDV